MIPAGVCRRSFLRYNCVPEIDTINSTFNSRKWARKASSLTSTDSVTGTPYFPATERTL